MIRTEMDKLNQKHRKWLVDHSPVDRVIENQGISAWMGNVESRFVASAGGDVSLWVVAGWKEPFVLGQK